MLEIDFIQNIINFLFLPTLLMDKTLFFYYLFITEIGIYFFIIFKLDHFPEVWKRYLRFPKKQGWHKKKQLKFYWV